VPTPEVIQGVLNLGAGGLLAIAVVGLVREWVVPGSAHRRVTAERDAAYQRLDRLAELFEAATKGRGQ
jgi:hypothetical protein